MDVLKDDNLVMKYTQVPEHLASELQSDGVDVGF